MIAWLERWKARRRLSPVVTRLPFDLQQAYGSASAYTPGQVRRAVERAKLDASLTSHALAALCALQSFREACPGAPDGAYRQLRSEIADLFGLDDGFTAASLRKRRIRRPWNPIADYGAADGAVPDVRTGHHDGSD